MPVDISSVQISQLILTKYQIRTKHVFWVNVSNKHKKWILITNPYFGNSSQISFLFKRAAQTILIKYV